MKVLLVNPPNEYMISANTPTYVDTEGGFNPPLGLLYLASYALQHTEHEIEILDALVENIGYDRLKEVISSRKPDLVGITTLTFTLADVIRTARLVKEISPDLPVVLGGPHTFIYPAETASLPEVDYVVVGEGEKVFSELLNNLGRESVLRQQQGLTFETNGVLVNNPPLPLIEQLDQIPFPARQLTPYRKYSSLLARHPIITTMITSRGCPYKCLFCERPHLGKVFRARSPENVVAEMESCLSLGIKEFLLYDDTFNIDRQRVLDICQIIRRKQLDITWDIRARINHMDREVLHELRRAGCERVHYGVEAGTEEILRVLRKGITLNQVREVFRMTRAEDISILAYFMLGSPGETRDQIKKTIDLAIALDPDYVHFSVTTPFPGTDLYRMGFERGLYKDDYWRQFACNPSPGFSPPFWEENLSREELLDYLENAYRYFYLRPRYVLRELSRVRSWRELAKKAKAGIALLKH